MNTINQHNITYKGGLKSINAVNPISLYTNRYFNRSAKLSGQKFDKIAPQLADKIKSIKLENISAWDVSQGNPKDYIFFLHGMSQNVSNYQHLYETALKHGKGVFAVEYRGYGVNPKARLSEDRLRKDVEKAYRYLTEEKNIKPENIIAAGHSMGGALAADFASKHQDIKSLVLISPITSLMFLGKKFMLNKNLGMGIPTAVKKLTDHSKILKWMYNLRFNSLKKLAKINTPTYIIHSRNDSVTLLDGARKLAKTARREGILQSFTVLPTGGHKVDSQKVIKFSDILDQIG